MQYPYFLEKAVNVEDVKQPNFAEENDHSEELIEVPGPQIIQPVLVDGPLHNIERPVEPKSATLSLPIQKQIASHV